MNDAYELLPQKEADLERVRHEIEALQITATLLSDDIPSNDRDKEIMDQIPPVSTGPRRLRVGLTARSIQDRRARIEVGYGLEPILTDGKDLFPIPHCLKRSTA
jgi:hypothetical protein